MGGSYVGGLYQEHLISKLRVSLILFTHISVSLDWFYFISFLCVCVHVEACVGHSLFMLSTCMRRMVCM